MKASLKQGQYVQAVQQSADNLQSVLNAKTPAPEAAHTSIPQAPIGRRNKAPMTSMNQQHAAAHISVSTTLSKTKVSAQQTVANPVTPAYVTIPKQERSQSVPAEIATAKSPAHQTMLAPAM